MKFLLLFNRTKTLETRGNIGPFLVWLARTMQALLSAVHCKKGSDFPESLVIDIPAGDGTIANLFLTVYRVKT
jgi:hypothetical protein